MQSAISQSSVESISNSINNSISRAQRRSAQAKTVMSQRGDDRLSIAETGLLFAAFSTLLCSMMLNVIVP